MIINGGARSNWWFFAKHLMRADQNERIAVTEIRGLASDNVRGALREMDALASGTRCKNFFYHANLNPRAGEQQLTESQWEQAVDRLEHNLGLEGHSRFIVEHEKPDGRIHRHVIWSRIDPDSMTAKSDSRNYAAHEKTARELERLFGHVPVQGVHVERHGAERPERRPAGWETFRGKRSGIDPDAVKATLTAVWQRSDTGSAFRTALKEAGYVLCKGDRRDFVAVDPAGDDHSLARRIQGAKAADIRARMADIDPKGLPTVAEGRLLIKTADGGAASTHLIERNMEPAVPPNDPAKREERLAGDLLTSKMQEEVADYMAGSGTSSPEAPTPIRHSPSGWQQETAGVRTGWKAIAPRDVGETQRLCPPGRAWRSFVDRTLLFADAAYEPWHTNGGDTTERESRVHLSAHLATPGDKTITRRKPSSWAASIEEGPTTNLDRATGTSWQERIRHQYSVPFRRTAP